MLSEPHSSGGGDASGATGGALGLGGGGDGGLYARFHSYSVLPGNAFASQLSQM